MTSVRQVLHICLMSSHQTFLQNDTAVPSPEIINISAASQIKRWVPHKPALIGVTRYTSSFPSSSFLSFLSFFLPQVLLDSCNQQPSIYSTSCDSPKSHKFSDGDIFISFIMRDHIEKKMDLKYAFKIKKGNVLDKSYRKLSMVVLMWVFE